MSETTRLVIVNAEEFGLRESADFLEQHSDECDPAYLAAVAASMRQAADLIAAHAQAVQRLTEERDLMVASAKQAKVYMDSAIDDKKQAEAALAALRAQVAALPDPILLDSHFVTDPFFCKWCRASWNVKKQKDWDGTFYRCVGALAHPDNGCLARLRPRPEGETVVKSTERERCD